VGDTAERYVVRDGRPEEQRELTRLCVRATMQSGYDEGFIDRVMPGLTITMPLITGGCVQVAEEKSGAVVGVVTVTTTMLQGPGSAGSADCFSRRRSLVRER
jgi:hypothetical protein